MRWVLDDRGKETTDGDRIVDVSVSQVEEQETIEQTLVDLASQTVAQSVEAPKIVSERDVAGVPMSNILMECVDVRTVE